jgi:hypothetical protein
MRTSLTKLGHLDENIQTVHAFKNGNDRRYLRVSVNDKTPKEVISKIDKRINSMGELTKIGDFSTELDNLFTQCLERNGDKTYLLYFDRPTFTKVD